MYSHRVRRPPSTPTPLDNRALLAAVRTISNSLVRRATLAAADPAYSILLTDIWAQARYAGREVLALRSNNHQRRVRRRVRTTNNTTTTKTNTSNDSTHTNDIAKLNAERDTLVRLLYKIPTDSLADNERKLTTGILQRSPEIDVDALRRLWGVPAAVFEAASVGTAFHKGGQKFVLIFYDALISKRGQESRVFNVLWWRQTRNHVIYTQNQTNKKRKRKNDFPLLLSDDDKQQQSDENNNMEDADADAETEIDAEMDLDIDDDQLETMQIDTNNTNQMQTDREILFGSNDAANGPKSFRTISKVFIIEVIRILLTKRRSPFFEQNMPVVLETVLYGIHPDRCVTRFRESQLREARFYEGLQAYEYSRSFTASLENLHLGKLNRLLKDIRAVRTFEPPQERSKHKERVRSRERSQQSTTRTHSHSSNNTTIEESSGYLSIRALRKYCSDRDTLTERALQGVMTRYVRNRFSPNVDSHEVCSRTKSKCGKHTNRKSNEYSMTDADFVRMYLALIGCGTDQGVKYWFAVLDQDGDGWVGIGDIAHFYKERKIESEKRNGVKLADVHSLWVRLCAMSGVSPIGKGITLQSLRDLNKEDREFVMCALLVRRADDGNLINVAATVSADTMPNGKTV